ncbi:MAG: FAD-binding oxidoreductase, partial [Nitrospirota bacterium]
EKWARVQPGIVLTELNKRLLDDKLMFGPDPSSRDMCKLGGMLANNSSGPHTLRYGSVKDNVRSLRVRMDTGGWLDAQAHGLDDPVLSQLLDDRPVLKTFMNLVREQGALIKSRRPRVSKNSSGYNVFDLLDGLEQGVLDLPKIFVGSEGTLGIFSEATLTLVDRPRSTATAMIHFQNLEELGEAVPELLELTPNALEVMDGTTLDLIGRRQYDIPRDSAATLLIEFDQGEDPARSERLISLCRGYRLATDPVLAFDPEKQEELWKARNALYPTLYRFGQGKKPINFVDDVVVPAHRTAELIRYLEGFFKGQNVEVAVFGHIGNGNAHILPLLDLNDSQDFERMLEGHREIHQMVLEQFNGSICGEHGDGRVRAEWVRRMFGEELYQLFVQIKTTLNPTGLFNPCVKISDESFTQHIDYERLSKPCATCAKCNSVCPVYDVFQSEDMSSRGWFEIVTASDYNYLNSKRVVEACLNCKSCRTICPADVDVADLILQRRAENPNRLAGWVFALHARQRIFEPLLKMAAWTQPLWDRSHLRTLLDVVTRPILRRLAEGARIPPNLLLPQLAKRHLRDRFPELCQADHLKKARVAYFHGCAANYLNDGVGDAIVALLARQGIKVALPPQRCSGTPVETYGFRDLVKEGARENLQNFASYDIVLTSCASCTLSLKDYIRLFQNEPEEAAAVNLAGRVKHISEYLVQQGLFVPGPEVSRQKKSSGTQKVTYHSSCHLRAAGVTKAPRQLLARLPGFTYVEMQDADRCAGGAGTYIIKDYEVSQRIFERKRQAIAKTQADIVATSCPACMIQLRNGLRDKVIVKHVAELVNDAQQESVAGEEKS